MTFKNSVDRIREDIVELKEMVRALKRNQILSPTSPIPKAPTDVYFGAPWVDCEAYATYPGAPSVNSDSAPSIQPKSSNFPPSMSTNYGGQPTNNWGADSFMSRQGESYYQDSLYRDSNFRVYQQENQGLCQKEIEALSQEIEEDSKVLQLKFHSPKVISHTLSSFEVAVVEVASKRMGEFCEFVEIEAHKIDDDLRGFQIQNESSLADDLKANASIEVESSIEELGQETDSSPQINHPSREIEEDEQELQTQIDSSKVISVYPSFAKINVELVKITELGKHCIASVKRVGESVEDLTDIRTDFRKRSVEFLEFLSAHKLFVKMSRQGESPIAIAADIVKYRGQPMNSVFDPGVVEILVADSIDSIEGGIADFGENAYKLFDEMPSGGITMMGREY